MSQAPRAAERLRSTLIQTLAGRSESPVDPQLSGRAEVGAWVHVDVMDVIASHAVRRRRCSRLHLLLAAIAFSGCRAEPEAHLSTRIEALEPQALPPPSPPVDDAECEFVEREARKLNASLPRQLDADTAATRVTARGCALTLEYRISNLAASEVAPSGMLAMREQVVVQLCEDTAARATLERGGTFTNVYYDDASARIGEFTVGKGDCASPRSLAGESSRL